MSRAIFNCLAGGTVTLDAADTGSNKVLIIPAADGTLLYDDGTGTQTFDNIALTGAVTSGDWHGSTVEVAYGGTGVTTLTGLVFGNGASPMTAATAAQIVAQIGSTFVANSDFATNATNSTSATNIVGGLSGSMPYQTAAGTTALLPKGTDGQVLSIDLGLPKWISVSGAGTVTSVDGSGGTTGLTVSGGPITGSGTLTLGGTLAVANGGTGATSAVAALTALGAYPASNPNGYGTGTVTSVTGTAPVVSSGGTTPAISMAAATTSVSGYLTSTDWNTFNGKGTVTAVSVVSANGFTGSSSGGATPALTLTTSITGVLKGNGTALSAATAGTDFVAPGTATNFTAQQYFGNVALTDAATVAWAANTAQTATFTFVSTNRTMGAPTGLVDGAFYALAVIQNGGSNTLTWNSVFKWAGGVAPTLSTAAGAKDYFVFRSDGTNLYQQGQSLAVA